MNVAQRHALAEVNQQNLPTAPFAGTIGVGRQTGGGIVAANGSNINRRLWCPIPQSLNQGIPVPSVVAFAVADLGHNQAYEMTSAGAVNQPLPRIRDLAVAGGAQATTAGALNSTGMETNWRQQGAGSINLWGDSPIVAQAAAVDVAGGSFAVAGTVVTFTAITGSFTLAMVGRAITIAGATSPANDGTFTIASFVSANVVTYVNATPGVAEAFIGTWRCGDTINKLAATHVVPAGGARTLLSDGVSNWRVIAGLL
jgi:hypothetical protein